MTSAITPAFTTREYRDKIRSVSRLICRKGHDAMREYWHVIEAARQFKLYHRIDIFTPYDYQQRWFASGAMFRLRLLSAANRIGKTYSAATEFTYHATGDYPAWWQGFICPVPSGITPNIMWAIGVSEESTRKVLQKELLGTADARRRDEIGTGSIPRECIDLSSLVTFRETIKSVRIWHKSGGQSEIHFYSATQDESVLMGQAIVFAWVDEQSPDEVSLIGQCTTRTATTGGCVAVTATPELGVTDFYAQCKDDKTGKIYFQNATWYDCPHFTPEIIEEMLARTPYFQRKMRSLGIPVMGVGAIYPYSDEEITCAPFPIPDSWSVMAALDFGYSGISDPSIILFIAYNPETDTRYVFGEWSSEMDRDAYANSHLPDYMARKLTGDAPDDWTLNSGKPEGEFDALGFPGIVVKSPHDGNGIQPGTQQTRAEIMRKIGANVHPQLFEIPPDLLPLENNKRSLTGSIALCAQWFKDGKLKIFTSCIETMRELRLYQWQQKGSRSVPADKDNHFMDAMRIGAIRVSYDGDYMSAARSRVPDEYNDENTYITSMGAFDL